MNDSSKNILEACIKQFKKMEGFDLEEKIELINQIRIELSNFSPFCSEPVDCVQWIPMDNVVANDYNPNNVAPPEMELLRLSIESDGYTQPIVTNEEEGMRIVVDGFHRNRVGRENKEIKKKIYGYLPIVQIRATKIEKPDRMASTIRHNRARGKHQVQAMSDIVLELKRRNWTDKKIGKELGMDDDEVLRLSQIGGLADAFMHIEFSEAWEAELSINEEDNLIIDGEVNDH